MEEYLTLEEYKQLPREERFRRTIKLSKTEEERAAELHRKLTIVDLHDHPMAFENPLLRPSVDTALDGAKLSGVTCFLTACLGLGDYVDTMEAIGRNFTVVHQHPELFTMAYCAEDIRRAKKDGKIAMMPTQEGGSGIGAKWMGNLAGAWRDQLDVLYGLGLKSIVFTPMFHDYTSGGRTGRYPDQGLTWLGLDILERMNELGILVDLAHSGPKTSFEIIEASKDPVVYSHCAAAGLRKSLKLITDEEMMACTEKGGVLGIKAVPNVISRSKRQGIWDMLDHIDYVVNLVGVDHVGIGADISYADHVKYHKTFWDDKTRKRMDLEASHAEYLEGIENDAEWPNITRGLVSRGYSDQNIEKILGGNALKLIERVIG